MASAYRPELDPHSSAAGAIAATWVEFACAAAAVGLRFYVKLRIDKKVTADDWLIVLSFVCLLVMCVLYTIVMQPIWDLLAVIQGRKMLWPGFMHQTTFYLKSQFAIIFVFWTVLWAAKLSLLVFYKGLFDRGFRGWQRWTWWVVTAFTIAAYFVNWGLQWASCRPLSGYWHLGGCNSPLDVHISNVNLYVSTALDLFSDVLIAALPFSILPKLELDIKTKLGLGVVFLSGGIVMAFSALRLALNIPHGETHVNPKWLVLMTTAESAIAVTVACAPSFRRLGTSWVQQRRESKSRRQHSSAGESSIGTRVSAAGMSTARKTSHKSGAEMYLSELSELPSGRQRTSDGDSHVSAGQYGTTEHGSPTREKYLV